jgi:hypothetical protein
MRRADKSQCCKGRKGHSPGDGSNRGRCPDLPPIVSKRQAEVKKERLIKAPRWAKMDHPGLRLLDKVRSAATGVLNSMGRKEVEQKITDILNASSLFVRPVERNKCVNFVSLLGERDSHSVDMFCQTDKEIWVIESKSYEVNHNIDPLLDIQKYVEAVRVIKMQNPDKTVRFFLLNRTGQADPVYQNAGFEVFEVNTFLSTLAHRQVDIDKEIGEEVKFQKFVQAIEARIDPNDPRDQQSRDFLKWINSQP